MEVRKVNEIFAKPGVGAIIEKICDGKKYILIQDRVKENESIEVGMVEIPAGKIREFENIFDTLRREVREETGLNITKIIGEDEKVVSTINGYETISYSPFCSTQNVTGGYSMIVQIFICHAEGELLNETNETANIRWELLSEVERLLVSNPEKFYPMHINTLFKYISNCNE